MKKKLFLSLIFLVIILVSVIIAAIFLTNNKKEATHSSRPGEFSNTQPYTTYKDDHFEINYPNWPNIDKSQLPNADLVKVAVSNQGCSFFLKRTNLPAMSTLQSYTDKVIKDFGGSLKVNKREVTGNKAYLDAEITMAKDVVMKNISNVYQVGNTLYSMAFVSEKSAFPNVCGQLVDEVVKSVQVKE
jgi:hypothetical protein